MKIRFSFRFLQHCQVELESNPFDTLQQCLDDLEKEIQRLDDSMLKRALRDQFIILTKKIQQAEVRT